MGQSGNSTPDSFSRTPLQQIVDRYARYYASGSRHTAKAKRVDLNHFMTFLMRDHKLSSKEKLLVDHWDHSSVQRFIEDRLARGEAPATVSRRLATLKHMGRTFAEKIPGFVNPAKEVKPPKLQVLCPKALSEEEIDAAIELAKERREKRPSFSRERNQMLFLFLLDTGLRADEVRLLRRGQIDEDLEWISNVRTKGKRFRNVYITSRIRDDLKAYFERRLHELKRFYENLTVGEDKKLPVFISTYGADPENPDSFLMGAKSVWRAIRELSPDTKLHPHLLRHSYAHDLLDTSQDVRLVAQALGHSDVRVTMRYTERADRDIAQALEQSRSKHDS